MAPWVSPLPARIRKQYCTTGVPNCRGLSFYQSLGFRRRARVAAEAEFSKIHDEASEAAKDNRQDSPWDRREEPRIQIKEDDHLAPLEESYQEGKEQVDTPERDLLDELSMEAIESLWVAIKAKSMVAHASQQQVAAQEHKANVEKIGMRDFLHLGKQHFNTDGPMKGLLEEIFRFIDLRSNGGAVSIGQVRTHDVITALVLLSRYEQQPKLRTLFNIFDADDDGCVALDEMFDLFVSVKANDLTLNGTEAQADAVFSRELSLQAAKRLFEMTVPHLSIDNTDLLVFDDFYKAVLACPVVQENLLPGFFSMAWLRESFESARHIRAKGGGGRLTHIHMPARHMNSRVRNACDHSREVRKNFIATLRRGEEDLDLSTRLGRGERIMRHIMNIDVVDSNVEREQKPALPRHSMKHSPLSGQRGRVHTIAKNGETLVVAPPKDASRPPSAPPLRARIQAAAEKAVRGRPGTADGIYEASKALQTRPRTADRTSRAGQERQPKNEKSRAIRHALRSAKGDDRGRVEVPAQTDTNFDRSDPQSSPSPARVGDPQTVTDSETRAQIDGEEPIDHLVEEVAAPRRAPIDYDMRETATSVQLPAKPKGLRLGGENSKRFRQAMMDEQTEQQYRLDCARDAMKGNKKYECALCLEKHHMNKRRHDPHEQRALCHH